ncbi:hypothetical protein HanHA300_Chr05g0170031 [Helianthus annuus]|nr:hypothetical protein HanHA300_Chr05g0170031 [Helianthus annuus]
MDLPTMMVAVNSCRSWFDFRNTGGGEVLVCLSLQGKHVVWVGVASQLGYGVRLGLDGSSGQHSVKLGQRPVNRSQASVLVNFSQQIGRVTSDGSGQAARSASVLTRSTRVKPG